MKPISVYVAEADYEALEALAARRGRPVAELIREAMSAYLEAEREGASIGELAALDLGRPSGGWERHELHDEMLERRAP